MLGTAIYQITTTTGSTAIPEGWEVPEGWDTETNAWIPGYGVPQRHLAAGANCTRTPFSGAPWQLPTKDTLLIGAEYFDGELLLLVLLLLFVLFVCIVRLLIVSYSDCVLCRSLHSE
jgi:hypothetical protein